MSEVEVESSKMKLELSALVSEFQKFSSGFLLVVGLVFSFRLATMRKLYNFQKVFLFLPIYICREFRILRTTFFNFHYQEKTLDVTVSTFAFVGIS